MANISDLMGGEDRHILSTGNSELDKKIADGLPLESLTLIEGENDTGKSVLTQQIIWGAMKQGFSVDLFTTESTTKSFIKQMESMSLDISDYFAWGYIKVFPLHVVGFEWKKEDMVGILAHLITHIQQSKAQVIIIDSLTLFTEYAATDAILTFFTSCKSLVDQGKDNTGDTPYLCFRRRYPCADTFHLRRTPEHEKSPCGGQVCHGYGSEQGTWCEEDHRKPCQF